MRSKVVWWVALAILVGLGAGSGFIIGSTEHPWHEGWNRSYRNARTIPVFRRLVAFVESRPDRSKGPAGLWATSPDGDLDRAQEAEMARLSALGYVDAYKPARAESGVTIHVKDQVWPGLNLMNSGHANAAMLLDMEGNEVHRWAYSFADAFPGREVDPWNNGKDYWRRVYLYPNGDLLAIHEGLGLVRVDRDSNLLWALPCGCHHDLDVEEGEDGRIFVLTRAPEIDARIHEYEPVLVDYVAVVSAEGEMLREMSIADALIDSRYAASLLTGLPSGDVFHTNTIELIDGSLVDRLPAFRAGSLLISMRELDTIAVFDPDEELITWTMSGPWHRQHQPNMVGNGNMLVFDNRGHEGQSKVIEFDPTNQQVAWEYLGTPENGFYSRTSGSVKRLPNGNTLVSESDSGRSFEVTADGRRVWEYSSPHRGGENNELVAALQEVQRFPTSFFDWLN